MSGLIEGLDALESAPIDSAVEVDIEVIFGEHLADFYECLRAQGTGNNAGSGSVDTVVWALAYLEADCVEAERRDRLSSSLVDVLVDCQKKCVQLLRVRCAEAVTSLVSTCRKKLRAKTALDAEASAQHPRRHCNALLDLLGGWSNCVAEVVAYPVSIGVKTQVLMPLHERIMESAFECFEQFKFDKSIAQWLAKAQDVSGSTINIVALDAIIVQIAYLRELVSQYHSFLSFSCGLNDIPSGSFDKWRELDVIFVALDSAYSAGAMREAVRDAEAALLLDVEEGKPKYVLQGVEDAFFVLRKVVSRAISTGSDTILLAVGNRIIDLVGSGHAEDTNDKHTRCLFAVVVDFQPYYGCVKRYILSSNATGTQCDGPNGPLVSEGSLKTPQRASSLAVWPSPKEDRVNEIDGATGEESYLGSDAAVSVGMSIANALVTAASAAVSNASISSSDGPSSGISVTGLVGAANSWLLGLSEAAAPRPEATTPSKTPDARNTPTNEIADISPLRNIASAFFGVAEAFHSVNESQVPVFQTPSKQSPSSRNSTIQSASSNELAVEDAIVRLNTMSVACVSLETLKRMLLPPDSEADAMAIAMTEPETSSREKRKIAPNEIMATELDKVRVSLHSFIVTASYDLSKFVFDAVLMRLVKRGLFYDVDMNEAADLAAVIAGDFGPRLVQRNYQLTDVEYDKLSVEKRFYTRLETYFDAPYETEVEVEADVPRNAIVAASLRLKQEAAAAAAASVDAAGGEYADYDDEEEAFYYRRHGVRIWSDSKVRDRLSAAPYGEYLKSLASLFSEFVIHEMAKVKFSEWGAMLFHQEVLSAIQLFDRASEESCTSLIATFRPLRVALGIITLGQPAAIHKFGASFYADVMPLDQVRALMRTRVDFAEDVIARMKL